MLFHRLQCAFAVSIALAPVFAQAPGVRSQVSIFESQAQPPVPNDPLELATGAQPIQNAEQRLAATSLLANARSLSNVRAQAYDLKTTFTSNGSSSSDGSWSMEDISPSHGLYRWTAEGPSYSAVNLYTNGLLYSNQPSGSVPLRLAQVRTAIFFMYPVTGPRALLRTAAGNLSGVEVSCVLVSHTSRKLSAGGRRWEESEYCVDPKSGLLMTYSPAPGLYVVYDYSNAIRFHDKVIPGKFTITQAGQTIIQARTESVTDPAKLDHAIFEPSGLNQIGVGSLMTPPWHVVSHVGSDRANPSRAIQVVVIHGMLSPEGTLSETEIVSSTDASLNQTALDRAAKWQPWQAGSDVEPGATPQSHEIFFTVQFAEPAS
jgi:hypothetical protein